MNIKKYEHRHLIRFLLLKFHNLSLRFPLYAQRTHKNCTENAHSNDFKCVLFEVPFGNTVVVDEPALCGVRPVSNVCIFFVSLTIAGPQYEMKHTKIVKNIAVFF